MRERYVFLGTELLSKIGKRKPDRVRTNLSGLVRTRGKGVWLEAPWPTTTAARLHVLAHEVAHVILHFKPYILSAKRLPLKPAHVEEYEAERWATTWLRVHGVRAADEIEKGRVLVADHIRRDRKSGVGYIDPAAEHYALF